MGQGIILSIAETCKDDYTTVKALRLFWLCIQSTLPKRVGLRTKSSSCKIAYIDIEIYMWRNVICFTLFVLMKKVIPLYRALLSLLIKLYNYWRASKILPVEDLKSTLRQTWSKQINFVWTSLNWPRRLACAMRACVRHA